MSEPWSRQLDMRNTLDDENREMEKGAIQFVLVCALLVMSIHDSRAIAGDRVRTIKQDWADIVLSLWFSSWDEYWGSMDRRSLDARRAAVQRGEPKSFIITKADKSRRGVGL